MESDFFDAIVHDFCTVAFMFIHVSSNSLFWSLSPFPTQSLFFLVPPVPASTYRGSPETFHDLFLDSQSSWVILSLAFFLLVLDLSLPWSRSHMQSVSQLLYMPPERIITILSQGFCWFQGLFLSRNLFWDYWFPVRMASPYVKIQAVLPCLASQVEFRHPHFPPADWSPA